MSGTAERLRQLAKERAYELHQGTWDHERWVWTRLPHLVKFEECPYPDCVLVRSSVVDRPRLTVNKNISVRPEPLTTSEFTERMLSLPTEVTQQLLRESDLTSVVAASLAVQPRSEAGVVQPAAEPRQELLDFILATVNAVGNMISITEASEAIEREWKKTFGASVPERTPPHVSPQEEQGWSDLQADGGLPEAHGAERTPQEPPRDADWAAFLRERHLLILEWTAEGQSFEQIAHTLSMDPMQVQLISMTPEQSTQPHARRASRT